LDGFSTMVVEYAAKKHIFSPHMQDAWL